jgi:hypothetical protein
MREVDRVRILKPDEIGLAMPVYRFSLPYLFIVISDGLGIGDRPFTVPTDVPLSDAFNVRGFEPNAKYVIHAGDGYYGMTQSRYQSTLIHELMHVWQGERSSAPWHVIIRSARAQATGDAYAYDRTHWLKWNQYNPEQQAQIVEDWFYYGNKQSSDPRFNYVKRYIWGEPVPQPWLDSLENAPPNFTAALLGI